jgi:hypothetical protein
MLYIRHWKHTALVHRSESRPCPAGSGTVHSQLQAALLAVVFAQQDPCRAHLQMVSIIAIAKAKHTRHPCRNINWRSGHRDLHSQMCSGHCSDETNLVNILEPIVTNKLQLYWRVTACAENRCSLVAGARTSLQVQKKVTIRT